MIAIYYTAHFSLPAMGVAVAGLGLMLAMRWLGFRSALAYLLPVVLFWAALPGGVAWRHIVGAGLFGGVGFTVSLFITGLAFTDKVLVEEAKVGVLAASLIAGLAGYLFLLLMSREQKQNGQRGGGA